MPNPQHFVSRLRAYLREHRLVAPGQPLGVAVSGGADSVCLLHSLREALAEGAPPLHVLHLNHGLRGADADADEAFVHTLADDAGLPFHLERVPPAGVPATGFEAWARQQRLAFFHRIREQHGLQGIATGHTRRDQAETVLLHLLRGAGPRGLGGMAPATPAGILHPLLWASREDVLAYLTERGLPWREDASNQDPRYTRNALRLHWLPALRDAFNPNLEQVLASAADLLRDDNAALDALARQHLETAFTETAFGLEAPVDTLRALPPAILRRVLALAAARFARHALDFQHIEAIRALLSSPGHGSFRLAGLQADRSGPCFRIAPQANATRNPPPMEARLIRKETMDLMLPELGLLLEIRRAPPTAQKPHGHNRLNCGYTGCWSTLDPSRLVFPLTARLWRHGDLFQPASARSARKIKALFQRAGVPRWRRAAELVLESNSEIVWTRSFGTSHSAVAGEDARDALALRVIDSAQSGFLDHRESRCGSVTS